MQTLVPFEYLTNGWSESFPFKPRRSGSACGVSGSAFLQETDVELMKFFFLNLNIFARQASAAVSRPVFSPGGLLRGQEGGPAPDRKRPCDSLSILERDGYKPLHAPGNEGQRGARIPPPYRWVFSPKVFKHVGFCRSRTRPAACPSSSSSSGSR